MVYRTPLKLQEHLFPEKFPLPLHDPLLPAYRVKKLDRISENRGVSVLYRKPQWKIEEEAEKGTKTVETNNFIYPVPRDPNPSKIRTRKEKLFRKISYKL